MAGVISPVAGTRTVPKDGYRFVRGGVAVFQTTFMDDERPILPDTATVPVAKIYRPAYLNKSNISTQEVIATVSGTLTPGQLYEFTFQWNVPSDLTPSDEYVVSYELQYGSIVINPADELFEVKSGPTSIKTKDHAYATVNDIRKQKFNIDSYLPDSISKDLNARNDIIQYHIGMATSKLREELSLHGQRGFSENYKLFVIYYTIHSIMLAARGEDGSSISQATLDTYASLWKSILEQQKRRNVGQGIPYGRS